MRLLVTLMTAVGLLTVIPGQAHAQPYDCPPYCDSIPASAWMDTSTIPLNMYYRWPGLAGVAVTASNPRWKFEEACTSPTRPDDTRAQAVAARAGAAQAEGQWQLQTQIVHWRGDTWLGGQNADATLRAAAAALRACQRTAPSTSPSLTTDLPDRVAAVISVGGQWILHTYLLSAPRSSTVVELSMWSTAPPFIAWPTTPDQEIFAAMAAPLCAAYVDSCR